MTQRCMNAGVAKPPACSNVSSRLMHMTFSARAKIASRSTSDLRLAILGDDNPSSMDDEHSQIRDGDQVIPDTDVEIPRPDVRPSSASRIVCTSL